MAESPGTMAERSPGVWRLWVYTGRDAKGRRIKEAAKIIGSLIQGPSAS